MSVVILKPRATRTLALLSALAVACGVVGSAPSAASAFDAPDLEGPSLVSSSVDEATLNIESGPRELTVRAHLTDRTGVETPHLVMNHASLDQMQGFGAMTLVEGTVQDGTWERVVTLESGKAPGSWNVTLYPLADVLGNRGTTFFEDIARVEVYLGSLRSVAPPRLAGVASVGSELTATPGEWSPGGPSVSFQWLRDGEPIDGATAGAYRLVPDDLGAQVSAQASASWNQPGQEYFYEPAVAPSTPVLVEPGAPTAPAPVVTGDGRVGGQLSVDLSGWFPRPTAPEYQWNRDGVPIVGAQGQSYVPTVADLHREVTVTASTEEAGYTPVARTSDAVRIGVGALSMAPTPSITGTMKVGSRLTAAAGGWGPQPVDLSYRWNRDGAPIPGANSTGYTLTGADSGKRISVVVTGTKNGYASVVKESAKTAKIAPGTLKASTPAVSGTVAVGAIVTVKPGTWTSGTKLSYQWFADGKAIKNATKSSYRIASANGGKKLTVGVTGTLTGYTAVSRTSSAKTVLKALSATPAPRISGTVRVGSKLKAAPGNWRPSPVTHSYQWLRNGAAIRGATKPTYQLTKNDAAKKITVRVTGKKSGYLPVTKSSAVKTVPKVMQAATPKISGSATIGSTLTAVAGKWTSGTKLSYQWYRSGTKIPGATRARFALGAADAGRTLAVKITGKKSGYASESRLSRATKRVGYPTSIAVSGWDCPAWAPIKGNASSMIYHMPGGAYYTRTKPEMCFATETAAQRAGFRRAMR